MSHSSASVSSEDGGNNSTYNKLLEDFKSAISKRKMPKNLVFLSRFLFMLITTTIIISSVDYSFKTSFLSQSYEITLKLVMNESKTIRFIEVLQNMRSLLNIANGLEFDYYKDYGLQRIDRFNYLL